MNKIFFQFLTVIFFSILPVISVFSEPGDLISNSLKMEIQGEIFHFQKNVTGVLENKFGKSYLFIGIADEDKRIEMVITAVLPQKINNAEYFLNSVSNPVSMTFKSKIGSFMILPAVRYAKVSSIKKVKNAKGISKREMPEWIEMSASERLKTGKGIIRISEMMNNKLFLRLQPIVKNGKVIEFYGHFSGIFKNSERNFRSTEKFIQIKNGEFRVEVKKQP
jgi:hypothetical protein